MWNKLPVPGKPLKAILALILMIAVSLSGVTLGAYVKEIGLFTGAGVGPKYYAFEVDGVSGSKSVAPGESVSYPFTVRNHNGGGTAQVPLHVAIAISFPPSLAGTGKVTATLACNGAVLASSDTGTLECGGLDLASGVDDTDQYTLTLAWTGADMGLLGGMKETVFDPSMINIRVSGYQ